MTARWVVDEVKAYVAESESLDVEWHEAIDEQVERAGGEAVVDLSVTSHDNAWTDFCTLLGLGLLPAYADVTVSGQIVRRREPRPSER